MYEVYCESGACELKSAEGLFNAFVSCHCCDMQPLSVNGKLFKGNLYCHKHTALYYLSDSR